MLCNGHIMKYITAVQERVIDALHKHDNAQPELLPTNGEFSERKNVL